MITLEKMLFLKSLAFFKDLKIDLLLEIASILEEQRIDAETEILEKGSLGSVMYLIVNGRVKIHEEERVFAELGEREVFGELSALAPEKRNASVSALEETLLLMVHHGDLFHLMERNVEVAKGMIQMLCQKIRILEREGATKKL